MDLTAKTLVRDVVSPGHWAGASLDTRRWLARLLRDEGVDLVSATASQLRRGTPVYVTADADLDAVQRCMSAHHIRRAIVLDGDLMLGILDLKTLVLRGIPEP